MKTICYIAIFLTAVSLVGGGVFFQPNFKSDFSYAMTYDADSAQQERLNEAAKKICGSKEPMLDGNTLVCYQWK